MDISELPNHGVTILVRCRGYDNGSPKLKDIDPNAAHLWTESCKPWDVVSVDTFTPHQRNEQGDLIDMDSGGDKVR